MNDFQGKHNIINALKYFKFTETCDVHGFSCSKNEINYHTAFLLKNNTSLNFLLNGTSNN